MKMQRALFTTRQTLTFLAIISLSTAFADTVEDAAKKALIPNLELRETAPADALAAISNLTGIKVFYNAPKDDPTKISASLKNIPASEALRYVTDLAHLKFTYQEDGVHVTNK